MQEVLTFTKPDRIVGESRQRMVYGYEIPGLVMKVYKSGRKDFVSVDQVIEKIKSNSAERDIFVTALDKPGSPADVLVPATKPVISRNGNGFITYTDTQLLIQDGLPIPRSKMNIFSLPTESLIDLKNILSTNIHLWRAQGISVDLLGSTGNRIPLAQRVLRHFLPVFYSQNILFTDSGEVRFIDVGLFDMNEDTGLEYKLRQISSVIGSYISLGLVNTVLAVKNHPLPGFALSSSKPNDTL